MIREARLIEMMKRAKDNLGYMSDMALELAQMADKSGLVTLAYLFRMAALEASTADAVIADLDDVRCRATSH